MDDANQEGCLQHILAALFIALVVAALPCSCKALHGTPASFTAEIHTPDGKLAANITGTYDPGKTWMERYLGPFGPAFSMIAELAKAAAPVAEVVP